MSEQDANTIEWERITIVKARVLAGIEGQQTERQIAEPLPRCVVRKLRKRKRQHNEVRVRDVVCRDMELRCSLGRL